jgi:TP901 family phage tail tape measure protein
MTEKLEFDLAVKNNEIDKELNKAVITTDKLEQAILSASGMMSKKIPQNGIDNALVIANKSVITLDSGIDNVLKSLSSPIKTSGIAKTLSADALSVKEFGDGVGASFQFALKQSQGLSTELQKISAEAVKIKPASGFAQSLGDSVKSAFSLTSILSTASGFFVGNVVFDALSKLSNGLREAVTESINFKRAQLEIETILPKNEKLTANLVGQLENLSKQYGTTATAQAKAYYEIISAGVSDATDGAKLLARANELATGGVTDTANTIDLLTTIYNVYGKEIATATEASDSLFKTVQLGKTTIAELSSDLGQALPIAKSFGIGLDEVGAVLAQLTNSGISTAESVTLLNAVLAAIARNGKTLGEGFNSAAVQTEGLGVVLNRLKERTNGSNDALFELLGRQEAVRAVQSLTAKGLENYNSILAEYTKKTGVAAEASKKIIDNDLGKQFSILGSNIADAGRSFIDNFTPAALAATKAINGFFEANRELDSEQTKRGLEQTRKEIEKLNTVFASGKISSDAYNRSIEQLNGELALLSNNSETAQSPLVLLSTGLEKDAQKIKAQIASIESGFGDIKLFPSENLNLDDLNNQLNATLEKINQLKTSPSAVTQAPADSTRLEAEKKLQADLLALRLQFATEEQTFNDQMALAEFDQSVIRNELLTTQIYDQKIREADAAYRGELEKNRLLGTAQEIKLANDISFQKREQALITAGNAKVLADTKAATAGKLALEQSFQNSRNTLIGQGFGLAAALAKDGSKTQFLIQKAGALAEIAIADGKARALIPAQTALIPFPANIAAAAGLNAYVTAQTALGAATVAAATIKGFESGGIVGQGVTGGADNRVATIKDGELVLNGQQQKNLFDAINSGNLGGGNIQVIIDGREVAIALRNQIRGGFSLA